MLKIRSINLVADDAGFEATKSRLVELGATHVVRDDGSLPAFIKSIGQMMPRLAIDGLGGEHGRRMLVALRPGGALVMHALQTGAVPPITPSVLMYQQAQLTHRRARSPRARRFASRRRSSSRTATRRTSARSTTTSRSSPRRST